MSRGRLRVFLGAAPGVGKTFAMLEEGHRLQGQGHRVVVGVVDAHGRTDITDLLSGLDIVPPRRPSKGALDRQVMDLDAILTRRPDIVLVDESAAANPPGSPHDKRWDEIDRLLDFGIDVVSTLNIQNLESLTDIVFGITGVREHDTIADQNVRMAQVELVDLPEERIRERLTEGRIYPAEDVDAVLANYFRPENLSALREMALSWTADHVDERRAAEGGTPRNDRRWGARERIVVWLSAFQGADVVVRKAAHTARPSHAELLGVYVRPTSGLADADVPNLSRERELLEGAGGVYHELVGDDIAEALISFARAEGATQIVVGSSQRSSRRGRGDAAVLQIIRKSGDIEVRVVPYEASPLRRVSRPDAGRTLGSRRVWSAWLLTVTSLPLLTLLLLSLRGEISLENVLLVYLLTSVAVGVVGGAVPAVTCGVAGFLLANWYFTPPFHTWKIADAAHLFSLFAFLVVASAVGLLVGNATRRSAEARKARAQAEALAATATAYPAFGPQAGGLTSRIRDVFAMNAAAVLIRTDDGWDALATVGATELGSPDEADEVIPLTDETVLALSGGTLTGDDRRVLRAFAAQMAQALEREKLERGAAAVETMAETDRLRTALLNAVSHDLRTPLATIKASVTSLLETEVVWPADQTRAFLQTILDETGRLNRVVGRLLDASRVQVGAVHVFFVTVGLDEVISSALSGLGRGIDRVELEIPEILPPVQTDPALLERVVANLIENALTWSPEDTPVRVSVGEVTGRVDLRIIDRGPGIPVDERETIFQPFQRLGDSSNRSGVGLGMAVARGFLEAMGTDLAIEDTPGGGTTMVISFKPAPLSDVAAGVAHLTHDE
jgi:two-component system sensor histidine kinase KdpD